MEIKFKAATNGNAWIPLADDADLSTFKQVDDFTFDMKPSSALTLGHAHAVTQSIAAKQPNGMRSDRAENFLFPVGYVSAHVLSIEHNGKKIGMDLNTILGFGLAVANHVHGAAESGTDFFLVTPPSSVKGGAKDTPKN